MGKGMYWHSPDYPFVRHLEAGFAQIREEAERLRLDEFADWPDRESYSGDWKVFGLRSADPEAPLAWTCAGNARRCPRSAAHVARIRGVLRAGFSLLLPGAHIHPHADEIDDRVRSHLALRVNAESGMRFGSEIVRWTDGKCLVFEGRATHEAANLGREPRLLLLLDLERWALTAEVAP